VATFKANLAHYGIVVSGQTVDLAPADGKLYALRDVTATVESIPLIASSVMSKKIAAGANVIVLDVKVGRGAFMKTLPEAITLAETMVDIGQSSGRRVVAVLSDMNQPLGHAVGNALEVSEALDTLHARGPIDFQEHCLLIVAQIIALGGKAENVDQARLIAEDLLRSGRALDKFRLLIRGQGGDERVIDQPERLPRARIIRDVPSPRTGYVAAVDAYEIGMNAVLLGAGRAKKGEPIDPAVGIVLRKKIGSRAEKGEPLFTIHASDETRFAVAEKQLLAAFAWSDEPTTAPPLVYRTIL
jgi:pyrimidine-nucleoside phosphorylase